MEQTIYKLAIVGSSRAPDSAYDFVKDTVKKFIPLTTQVEIVSGGASGIDTLAEKVANDLGLKSTIFVPTVKDWLGEGGFRERNIKIARYADMVISIALPYTGKVCYHCNNTSHDKTAGCWTASYAKSIGKPIAIAVVPQVFMNKPKLNQFKMQNLNHQNG